MTEEEIRTVAIGKRLPPSTQGFGEGEAIPQPHEVHGLPAWADIKIYNTAGWRWPLFRTHVRPAKEIAPAYEHE
jgi:hypothetical protein